MVMQKSLNKKLLKTAIFSSPLIALYGVTPVYIFNEIPFHFILFAGVGILLNVLMFWLINITVINMPGIYNILWKRYLFSYLFTFIVHLFFIYLRVIIIGSDMFKEVSQYFKVSSFIAYPIISLVAINTIIIIICNSILLAQKKEDAELEIENLKINNLEAQKKVLMQQLQPHFLFNTLSALKSLIKENPEEAENYVIKLSEFLRYTVQVHNNVLVTVQDELKFTMDYIELQKVRFENALQYYIDLPVTIYNKQVPAYALQTLVENAVKHNAFTDKRPLHIKITYEAGNILVWNNKLPAKVYESSGTGLKNLNHRYKIITGKEVEVVDSSEIFLVRVHLIDKTAVK
jgi:two-component system, LytTR family, sensor kinase